MNCYPLFRQALILKQRPFIPIIFFHGQKDHVFNINSTTLSYSPTSHTSFNSTTFCTDATNGSTFKVNGDGNPNIIEYGSKGIYDLLLQNASEVLMKVLALAGCQ